MEFLFPNFLWALGVLAIPIIIHLFYFRRFKKVEFTNVRYLKEIKEETSSRNKLKNLLVLLSRLLALALLVFAFAQPFIPLKKQVTYGDKAVSIFVDNSYSMQALSSDVPLLDKAKKKATDIVTAYSESDQFQIITHDLDGKAQRLVGKDNALAMIDDIEITPNVRSLSQILSRQKQVLEKEELVPVSYLVSDFQQSIYDIENYQDTTLEVNLIPLQDVQEKNVAIDSAWFEAPAVLLNQSNTLNVAVTNYGDDLVENVRISIDKDGAEKPVGTIDIEPGKTIVQQVNMTVLKSGWHDSRINITDYPVQFDDDYYISFNVDDDIRILSVNGKGPNSFMAAAFAGIDAFKLENQSVRLLDYGSLVDYDLVVLNDLSELSSGLINELSRYVVDGGKLLVFPNTNTNITVYNNLFESLSTDVVRDLQEVNKNVFKINTDDFVFANVYDRTSSNLKLPSTSKNFTFSNFQNRGQQVLLTYRDGSPYLMKYSKGDGLVYICSSSLERNHNDLVINAEVFIPMLYKMALSKGKRESLAYIIGENELIRTRKRDFENDLTFIISGVKEFIPGQRVVGNNVILDVKDQLKEAGFYTLSFDDELISKVAFNNSRKESDLTYISSANLGLISNEKVQVISEVAGADFSKIIGERERGVILWKWCLILALLFLAIETLLLRFWNT